ncbi:MAG: GNAT family N-acetyltransferase [Campylobacteraceae bacterium]|nr:GNAT family N-acetyltransferase [Campylobacteraceae bacterium]
MTIRRFEEDDRLVLQKLYLNVRISTFHWLNTSEFKLADFDLSTLDEIIWVAVYKNKVVGFISLYEPDNFIHNLYVDIKMKRQGIGSLLLDVVLQNTTRPICLKCISKNTKALSFYLSKGWKSVLEEEDKHGKYCLMHYNL